MPYFDLRIRQAESSEKMAIGFSNQILSRLTLQQFSKYVYIYIGCCLELVLIN